MLIKSNNRENALHLGRKVNINFTVSFLTNRLLLEDKREKQQLQDDGKNKKLV